MRTKASRLEAKPTTRKYRKPSVHPRTKPAAPGTKLIVARAPQTDEELWEYTAAIAGVEIPRSSCCPQHISPFEAFANAYFARDAVSIWWASRGLGGKSFLLSTLAWVELISLKANVTVLGGSADQSENVLQYLEKRWAGEYAPKHLLNGDPSKRLTTLTTNNTIRALTASQKSVRGPHPERLRLDEVDEMDQSIFEAALGQPISRHIASQTVIASTRQNLGGTMDYALNLAKAKGWRVYQWCYKCNLEPDGWLTKLEVERTKGRIPADMWNKEYELQEPTPKDRAIDTASVTRMFAPKPHMYPTILEPIVDDDEKGPIEFETPVRGMPYAHGIDWGQSNDYTVMNTYRPLSQEDLSSDNQDKTRWKLVGFHRFRRDTWPNAVGYLNKRLQRWGGAAFHDATGLGVVLNQYLIIPDGCHVEGVWLGGQYRAEIFKAYILAIESDRLFCPPIQSAENEHKFVSEQALFASGHPPDTFIAGALAFAATKHANTTTGRYAKSAGGKGASIKPLVRKKIIWLRPGRYQEYRPDPRGFDWEKAAHRALEQLCCAAELIALSSPFSKMEEQIETDTHPVK